MSLKKVLTMTENVTGLCNLFDFDEDTKEFSVIGNLLKGRAKRMRMPFNLVQQRGAVKSLRKRYGGHKNFWLTLDNVNHNGSFFYQTTHNRKRRVVKFLKSNKANRLFTTGSST